MIERSERPKGTAETDLLLEVGLRASAHIRNLLENLLQRDPLRILIRDAVVPESGDDLRVHLARDDERDGWVRNEVDDEIRQSRERRLVEIRKECEIGRETVSRRD